MPYHHGDLRQALLHQALAALATQPASELSLRDFAAHIGVSHSAAYRHFPDKKALLDAVAEEGFRQFRDRLRSATSPRAVKRLEAMFSLYLAFGLEQPNLYRLMFGPGFLERVSVPATDANAREAFATLLETVQAAQAAKALRPASAFLMSQTIWATLHGLTLFALDGELDPAGAQLAVNGAWKFLFDGLGLPPKRAGRR